MPQFKQPLKNRRYVCDFVGGIIMIIAVEHVAPLMVRSLALLCVQSYLLNVYGLLGKSDQKDSWQFQQSIYDACLGDP